MRFSEQDKADCLRMLVFLGLFVALLSGICLVLSNFIGIQFDHARHVVASVFTVIGLLWIGREVLSTYKRIFASVSFVILLIGCYSSASELYIKHFTFMGLGELPGIFSVLYVAVVFSGVAGAYVFIKRDLFHQDSGLFFNGV